MQLRSVPIFKHEYGVVVAKEKSAQVEPWALGSTWAFLETVHCVSKPETPFSLPIAKEFLGRFEGSF